MRLRNLFGLFSLTIAMVGLNAFAYGAGDETKRQIKEVVDATVQPLMVKESIPGMAVGLVVDGNPYVFNYGVASRETAQPVAASTLFEVGSISKTFTASLVSYAQIHGYLSLSDQVDKYFEPLRGTPFGDVTLLELGTHTAGNLPMQVPGGVDDDEQLVQYLKRLHPNQSPGTERVYSNVGIGTLGSIAAKAMGANFAMLMQERLFPALGLTSTYIDVPAARMADYAQGYTKDGKSIRLAPGELWRETYGVRTTAADLVRYLEANMNLVDVAPDLQHALIDTHTGYFKAGVMTQDLIWEQYTYPVALRTLLAGTAEINDAVPVTVLNPPERPRRDVWINKTGTTNGFAAYVAFVPAKRLGIVLLANKSFSLPERVTASYQILTAVATAERSGKTGSPSNLKPTSFYSHSSNP
jgi:beta-lactamase class C